MPRSVSESDEGLSIPEEAGRLVGLLPLAALVADAGENLVSVNPPLCEMLGYSANELIGTKFDRLVATPGPGYELFSLAGLPDRCDIDLVDANGAVFPAEAFRRRLANGDSLVLVADLSGRKLAELEHLESEKRRWQSDRIEALGRLAGGVAHDFNNFLAVLMLHVDILNLHLDADSPIRGRVAEIKEVAASIADTVRQLFAFGRKQPMTLAPAKLNPVIEQFAADFRPAAAEGIDVELHLEPDLGVCFVDQIQVMQILKNLAVNAEEAMPNGGILRIETSNIVIDPGVKLQPPGPYVQILLADTGVGMEPSTEAHIFEPFFSTKESDKGAGLALAMVYGIVKQSKGFIWVNSELGKGTSFRVQFPRIDAVQPDQPRPESAEAGDEQKTVLLVDDEPVVRRVTAEFLEMSGYKVLTAGSGMEALEVAQAHIGPIDLLLTDLSMPLMDGRETAERITKLHPETSVLFMSGNIHNAPEDGEGSDFISKPFSLTSLTDKVEAVLDGKGR